MKDAYGNEFEPPVPVRMQQAACEITDCNSNSGFNCSLSVFDHPDFIHPAKCFHRAFKMRNKND
jgi:hypothetical protein